jgi:hypothetical protein
MQRLADLQLRLKEQVVAHEQILNQLEKARHELQGELLEKEHRK